MDAAHGERWIYQFLASARLGFDSQFTLYYKMFGGVTPTVGPQRDEIAFFTFFF